MTTYAIQRLKALGICDATAYKVAQTLSLSSLSAGKRIWPASNAPIAWRLIINGIVAAITPTAKGVDEAQNIYGPESWFGEQPIINADTSYIEYVCVTDVELLSMAAPTFLKLLDTEPGFAKYMAHLTAWRAQRDAEMLMLMKAANPRLRTVLGLGVCFEAMAVKSNRPSTESLTDSITLAVNQDILAQLCGVSRTSFWETTSRLGNEGWLKAHYGKLEQLHSPVWRTVIRLRRESRSAKMNPAIKELLREFSHADMANRTPLTRPPEFKSLQPLPSPPAF